MQRAWVVVTLSLVLSATAASAAPSGESPGIDVWLAAQVSALCPARDGAGVEQASSAGVVPPPPLWAGNCPRYHQCICQCQQQGICCRNGCGSCSNECYEAEYACEDECIARYVSDGTVCDNTVCWLNPFCNFP